MVVAQLGACWRHWHGIGDGKCIQYNSKELNVDLGLNWSDYGARWYDASVGRWWSVDKLADEPEQIFLSPYNYTWNNPVILTDPDGNCPTCPTAIIGGAVGALIGGAVEIGAQLFESGEVSNWDAVGGAAVQDGVTGFTAGLTAGASLLVSTAASAGANVVGGVINNVVQGQDVTEKTIKVDAIVGAAAGVGGKLLDRALRTRLDDGVEFSADLTQTTAKTRSGHRAAGNKQLHEAMEKDPKLRKKMENKTGKDVFERTNPKGGRKNPKDYEWDHNTDDANKLDLRHKDNHKAKTEKDPGRQGGYSKYWKDKN